MVRTDCINNLVEEAELNALKLPMKTPMAKMLKEQRDLSGNEDVFNKYRFNKEKGWNYYERFMEGEFTVEDIGWINPTNAEKELLD